MSSPSGSSGSSGQWPLRRPSKRMKMRNGTFIIPTTGERSRRQFTLRTSSRLRSQADGPSYTMETSPETTRERFDATAHKAKNQAAAVWRWINSDQGHGVLKCTLAYLMGSLATFWGPLSGFLGQRDGKHVVATLTVYFHPARTAGSMLEAIVIAICAVIYATLLCLLSMGIVIFGRTQLDIVEAAHALVLIICLGGGLGFVGWVKQKMNQPLVNVGSTLTSIAIISVITKEEAIHDGYFSGIKIVQVLKMLLLGISFTTAVNLLVWPKSARRVLRQEMIKASISLSDKLSFIARGFLNGNEDEIKSADYATIRINYNSAYAKMTSTLREAKNEHYFLGLEKIYQLDRCLYKSLETLSQSIGGLRSALDTQFTLLKEVPTTDTQLGDGSQTVLSPRSSVTTRTLSEIFESAGEGLSPIDESREEDEPRPGASRNKSDPSLDQTAMFYSPSDIFNLFIDLLGPSMKSLSYTLSETLRESPFGEDPKNQVTINDQLRESLRDALTLYNEARGNALQEVYRSIELGRSRSEKIQADIEEVAAACGHFSFSLQAVAEEMDAYLNVLEDLKYMTATTSRSWEWLKLWKYWGKPKKQQGEIRLEDPEQDELLPKPSITPLKRSAVPKGIPNEMITRRDTFNWDAAPQVSHITKSISQTILKSMRFLTREDISFGIKVGIGAILFAQFAFIPSTRPIYQTWRGEWGLLSYMIVVGMTTGASNTTGTARFIGTLIGALCAIVVWFIGQENPFALAFLGWVVAFGNFYLILALNNAQMGRISLLAYNVVTLYAYSISQRVDDDDDDEGGESPLIFDITFHRVTSVCVGILWGMIVVRLLWPISARRKFREGLSVLYLQMGLIWKRGPLGILLHTKHATDYMREGEQAALQRYAFKLQSLCTSAKSEFELRGPFPHEAYGRIMRSTKHILDGFYAMRLLTQNRLTLSLGERAILEFTAEERVQLCQRICHVFQVLASCVMLEYPLTDAIPSIDRNRDRLLGKIYQFRKERMADRLADSSAATAEESDYALLYAYTLVTAQVGEELRKVRAEIEGLFGVLHEESLLLE